LEGNPKEAMAREALLRGEPEAVELIWELYAEGLFAYALSLLRSKADAEDALHELFLKAVRSREALAKARNLKAYLFKMLRNLALDAIEKRKREESIEGREDWLLAPAEPDEGALKAGELSEAMAKLPEEQRTAVSLRVFQGMQFNEIAEALEESQNTVASRFRYGIKRLRELLGR